MKRKSISIVIAGCVLLAVSPLSHGLSPSFGHKPSPVSKGDTQFGFSRDVVGTLVVTSTNAQGCGTLVCTTNSSVFSGCKTNGTSITCSNVISKSIICSNGVTTPTAYKLHQTLTGTITPNPTCDELSGQLPASAVFQAELDSDVRLGDWRGLHTGTFKILNGVIVVASGTLVGSNGVETHGANCAVCNHLEGALVGTVLAGGLTGAQVQATYAANLTGVTCPSSNNIPAGPVTLLLDGVVVSRNCPPP